MEFTFEFGGAPQDLTITASGVADVEGYVRMYADLVDDPRFRADMLILVEQSALDLSRCSNEEIEQIATSLAERDWRFPPRAVAIVASTRESCPYHFEWTDEEWLIAVAGQVAVRSPEGEQTLDPGDMVCFSAGPAGAHQVRNTSAVTARVAIVSTQNEFGIVEYPEDEKVGIWAGGTHYTVDHPAG
jgi:hypothetical protein